MERMLVFSKFLKEIDELCSVILDFFLAERGCEALSTDTSS
jgi:hypothetical protein